MKIAVVIQHFPPKLGGAERQAQLLANALARSGNLVEVITTRHERDLPARSTAQNLLIRRLPTVTRRWLKLPCNLVVGFLAGLRIVRRLDVVHAHCLSPLVLGALLAAKLARVPVLIKICSIGDDGDIAKVKGFGPGSLLWPLYLMADAFVAPTAAVARELRAGGARAGQVTVISNLLEESGRTGAADRREQRAALGLPARITLLYVGRLDAGKGLSLLMDVWPDILARYDAQLVLVGDGPERTGLEHWRSTLDDAESVVLAGYRSTPGEYYRAADIFVFPSRSETFGNAIVEAMSFGLAVATTPVGVVEEWPEDAPVARFGIGNRDEFHDLLCRLLDNGAWREELGCRAARFIAGRYGVDSVLAQYLDYYRRLTGGRRATSTPGHETTPW